MSQPFGGPWLDASGNPLANGTLSIRMTNDAVAASLQICAGRTVIVTLDGDGNFPDDVTLVSTGTMSPSSTTYIVTAYSQKGQLVWGPSQMTFTPVSEDFVLLESGDFVLLESGDFVLLE
jgi:hypothetical protein